MAAAAPSSASGGGLRSGCGRDPAAPRHPWQPPASARGRSRHSRLLVLLLQASRRHRRPRSVVSSERSSSPRSGRATTPLLQPHPARSKPSAPMQPAAGKQTAVAAAQPAELGEEQPSPKRPHNDATAPEPGSDGTPPSPPPLSPPLLPPSLPPLQQTLLIATVLRPGVAPSPLPALYAVAEMPGSIPGWSPSPPSPSPPPSPPHWPSPPQPQPTQCCPPRNCHPTRPRPLPPPTRSRRPARSHRPPR